MSAVRRLARAGAGTLKAHTLAFLAAVLSLFAAAAVMTDGRFDLLAAGTHFSVFYDELGRSILHGRFDVPPAAIGPEALLIGGRTYGYFGPTPALLRIPLDWLFPAMWGRWTRLFLLAATAASLFAAHHIQRAARRALGLEPLKSLVGQLVEGGFLLAAGLGTTLLFMARRPTLYHEALSVGVAFTLCAFAALLRYLAERKPGQLVSSGVLAIFAALGRASVATGVLLSLCLLAGGMLLGALLLGRDAAPAEAPSQSRLSRALDFFAIPSDRPTYRHVFLLCAVLALGGGVIAFRNLRTVGNLSGEPPLDKHVAIMANPARLARTQGKFVHPENLPTMLANYLRPDGVIFRARPPYFFPKPGSSARRFAGAHLDGAEPYVSLPSAYPIWLLLAGLGVCAAFARSPDGTPERRSELRLALLGSAAGCAAPFIAVYLTLRYLHDLFPFFILAGAVGLESLVAMAGRRRWARLGVAAVVLVGLYTVAVSVGVTLASARWT